MYYYKNYKSPIGILTLISDGINLIGLLTEKQVKKISLDIETKEDLYIFKKTENWLNRYFKGEHPKISELPLKPIGNEFRQLVWKELCKIPYGKVTTYKEIAINVAKQLHKEKMSAQAIGGAISHNPIAIIIPCHRVIGSNGLLTGYAGGLEIKRQLLELEHIKISDEKD